METYRILSNKRILFTIIVIFIINLVFSYSIENQNVTNESGSNIFVVRNLFQKTNLNKMNDSELSQKCNSLKNIILLNEYYKDSISFQTNENSFIDTEESNIRENDPKTAAWFDKNKRELDIKDIRVKYYFYSNELKKRNYLNSYSDYLSNTIKKSENTSQISIFDNSFSQKSFYLLSEDFNELGKLKLQNTNTSAFEKTVTNNVTNVLLILLVLILCITLFYNKDKNIDIMIRTCKNGRLKLFFRRLIVSSFLILISVIGLFAENFILYGFFYGYDIDVNLYVQCCPLFQSFPYGVSLIEYSIIFIVVKFLTILIIFLITYLLLSILSDLNTLLLFLTLFAGMEYLLYKYVAVYSDFSILHITNVISFLNDKQWIIYGIFNLFSHPVKIFDGMMILLLISLLALIIINALVSKKAYTIRTKNRLQLKINFSVQKILRIFSNIQDKFISHKGEYFKLFVSQKFLLVLCVVAFVFFNTYSFGIVEKQPVEAYLENFYAQYSGELNENTYQYIDEIRRMVTENELKTELLETAYTNGQIGFEEYSAKKNKYSTNDTIMKALLIIEDEIDFIDSQKNQGKTVFLIDKNGYNNLFGVEDSHNSTVHIVIFLLMLLFLTYGLISKDKNKNILCLLNSTVNGKKQLLKTKLRIGFLSTTIIYFVWLFIELLYIKTYFNIDNLTAPVQSIQAFSNFPLNINILMFTILFYFSRYIILISIFYIFISVNIFLENKISIIINFIFVILPCLLGFLGFDMISDFSITGILDFSHRYLSDPDYLRVYLLLQLLFLLTSLLLNILMLKAADKKGESL